ncbi:MAG: hypothetical protein IJI88_06725 [Atopobiaceae bacterium]|nr:hypothetical protein [Atopobiaceae bacterium]
MPYAFISHQSACEALRLKGVVGVEWPRESRNLPWSGECIRLQRDLKRLAESTDLVALGLVSRPIDVLVPTSLMRTRGKWARTHGWAFPLPRGSMRRVASNVAISTPEFVVLQLAHRHVMRRAAVDRSVDDYLARREALSEMGIDAEPPLEDLVTWERCRHLVAVARVAMEFAGTYRLPAPHEGTRYKQPRLSSIQAMLEFLDGGDARRLGVLADVIRARDALALAADNSASPMETVLFLLLTLPVEMGGFGLPRPVLNKTVGVDGKDGLTPDLLWEDAGLAIEYESLEFHAGAGRDRTDHDVMRENELVTAGYCVLVAVPGVVLDLSRLTRLAEQIALLLGVRLTEPAPDQLMLRERLHSELVS